MANYKVPRAVELVDELPRQRHRQGASRTTSASAAARDRSGASGVSDPDGRRPLVTGRPAGGRAGGVGGGPVGRRPAGRLGRRGDQGRGPDRRPHAQRVRVARASRATCPTRPSPSTTGASAAWSSTCATRTDRQHLEELLGTADVFISNLRPDALDKLDLEPEATVARHPRLVYCSVSGYGLRGEDRNRPTYDIGAFWARSGLSCRWPTATATRSTPGAASATTSPAWPPWPASWPRCSSSARPASAGWSRCRCCAPAPTCSAGTWASRWRWARWPGPSPATATSRR